jgi:sec-independent protein translocase protein TatA
LENAMLGSLGTPELLLIALVCIMLFGTKRLPELGRGVGEGIRNFKKAMSEGAAQDDGEKHER